MEQCPEHLLTDSSLVHTRNRHRPNIVVDPMKATNVAMFYCGSSGQTFSTGQVVQHGMANVNSLAKIIVWTLEAANQCVIPTAQSSVVHSKRRLQCNVMALVQYHVSRKYFSSNTGRQELEYKATANWPSIQ